MGRLKRWKSTGAFLLLGLIACLGRIDPAMAQLNIQSNPVFSTPPPSEQNFQSPTRETGYVEKGGSLPSLEVDYAGSFLEEGLPERIPLEAVEYEGNHRFPDDFLEHRLVPLREQIHEGMLAPGELESALEAINRNNNFKLKATVTVGETPEAYRLHLDVLERPVPWQLTTFFDNQGRPGIGTFRGGAQLAGEDLVRLNDDAWVRYLGSQGAHHLVARYNLPLNRYGSKFSTWYVFHDLTYDDLGLSGQQGQDNALYLQLSHPLDPKGIWTLYTQFYFRHVTLSAPQRGESVRADPRPWVLGLRLNHQDRRGSTLADVSSHLGQRWFGGDSKFWRLQGEARRILNLPGRMQLDLHGAWQWTSDPLPPIQQFQIGGVYTVRGYTEGLITAERGHLYSAEMLFPLPGLRKLSPWLDHRLRGVVFADFGQAWADKESPQFVPGVSRDSSRTTLFSVGTGFRYRLTRLLQGFFELGWGLFPRGNLELDSQPTVRIHFGIRNDWVPVNYAKRGTEVKVLGTGSPESAQ